VIVASGTSNRQTKALAASVRDAVREAGFPKPRIEGEANGEWIIVDCAQVVVHIMQPNFRAYYHLEELWGEKAGAHEIRCRQAIGQGHARLGAPPSLQPRRRPPPARNPRPPRWRPAADARTGAQDMPKACGHARPSRAGERRRPNPRPNRRPVERRQAGRRENACRQHGPKVPPAAAPAKAPARKPRTA
jgi:ribosome-associated protein